MPFDVQKLSQGTFEPRTADVPVPDLAEFFGEGEEATWRVRGLSGEELARCRSVAEQAAHREAIVEALSGNKAESTREAVEMLAGYGKDVPQDFANRIEMLLIASVEPQLDRTQAVRFANYYPIEFYQLTNKITELTGMGHSPGKPKRSTAKGT